MSLSAVRPFPLALALALAVAVSGCGRKRAPVPGPGTSQGTPPDLRGSVVMVLPFQDAAGIVGDPDAELAFALRDRGSGVRWVLPPRLQQALERSPGLNVRIHALQVGVFSQAEVQRVGDPLFGDLVRLGALVDAEAALIPLRAWVARGPEGHRVRLSAALLQVRTGRVLWFGVEEGGPAEPEDPGGLASAADALARRLLAWGR